MLRPPPPPPPPTSTSTPVSQHPLLSDPRLNEALPSSWDGRSKPVSIQPKEATYRSRWFIICAGIGCSVIVILTIALAIAINSLSPPKLTAACEAEAVLYDELAHQSNLDERRAISKSFLHIKACLEKMTTPRNNAAYTNLLSDTAFFAEQLQEGSAAYKKLEELLGSEETTRVLGYIRQVLAEADGLKVTLPPAASHNPLSTAEIWYFMLKLPNKATQPPLSETYPALNTSALKYTFGALAGLLDSLFSFGTIIRDGKVHPNLDEFINWKSFKINVRESLVRLNVNIHPADQRIELSPAQKDQLNDFITNYLLLSTEEFVKLPLQISGGRYLTSQEKTIIVNLTFQYLSKALAVVSTVFDNTLLPADKLKE